MPADDDTLVGSFVRAGVPYQLANDIVEEIEELGGASTFAEITGDPTENAELDARSTTSRAERPQP
jgi:hypothetical protein